MIWFVKFLRRFNSKNQDGFHYYVIHPTTSTEEIEFVFYENIKTLVTNHKEWGTDYEYNPKTNEFVHKSAKGEIKNGSQLV